MEKIKTDEPSKLPLFVILFGSMFISGLVGNIQGVTYPLIKTEFDVSYEQQGLMISLVSFGYMLWSLVGGILLGVLGTKKTFTSGYVFLILGLICIFFMPGFWSIAGAFLVIFAGFGLFSVSANALASQVFITRTALFMNLMHFFYGAGSILSPRIAGALSVSVGWRHVYILYLPPVLLILIFSSIARFPRQVKEAEGNGKPEIKKANFFTALRTPMVWVFSLALGLMMTAEMSIISWAGLYFQDVYNLDPRIEVAAFISYFYILYTISRLLSGFVIEKVGYLRSLFVAVIALAFILALGLFLGAAGIYVLPALGFFAAILWPTLMAAAMVHFCEDAPVMTSAIIVVAGAINSGIQYLIGLTNRLAGPAWGYRSILVYMVLIIAALALVNIGQRHAKTQRSKDRKDIR